MEDHLKIILIEVEGQNPLESSHTGPVWPLSFDQCGKSKKETKFTNNFPASPSNNESLITTERTIDDETLNPT